MSEPSSTKPYLVRALHEWCVDNGLTPHLMVAVDAQTRVPAAYVKNGEIVLNISHAATQHLLIDADSIAFSARFGGVSQDIHVPMSAVRGIFARENGQGMFFQPEPPPGPETASDGAAGPQSGTSGATGQKKSFLKLVK